MQDPKVLDADDIQIVPHFSREVDQTSPNPAEEQVAQQPHWVLLILLHELPASFWLTSYLYALGSP